MADNIKIFEKVENRDLKVSFDGDIIITDPAYFVVKIEELDPEVMTLHRYIRSQIYGVDYNTDRDDKPVSGEFGDFTKFIGGSTLWGDWFVPVTDLKTGKSLGTVAADSGMWVVAYVDDLKKHFPNFFDSEWDDSYTIIKGFKGDIFTRVTDYEYTRASDPYNFIHQNLEIVGEGNKNFVCGFHDLD